jgi:hypothetical protein
LQGVTHLTGPISYFQGRGLALRPRQSGWLARAGAQHAQQRYTTQARKAVRVPDPLLHLSLDRAIRVMIRSLPTIAHLYRRTWFLERVLKLGLIQIAKEYECVRPVPCPEIITVLTGVVCLFGCVHASAVSVLSRPAHMRATARRKMAPVLPGRLPLLTLPTIDGLPLPPHARRRQSSPRAFPSHLPNNRQGVHSYTYVRPHRLCMRSLSLKRVFLHIPRQCSIACSRLACGEAVRILCLSALASRLLRAWLVRRSPDIISC